MKERWDNGKGFLKDRLADYRVDPPEEVWIAVSSHLGRRSRKRVLLVILSAAATITLAVIMGIHLMSPGSDERAQEIQEEGFRPEMFTNQSVAIADENIATGEGRDHTPPREPADGDHLARKEKDALPRESTLEPADGDHLAVSEKGAPPENQDGGIEPAEDIVAEGPVLGEISAEEVVAAPPTPDEEAPAGDPEVPAEPGHAAIGDLAIAPSGDPETTVADVPAEDEDITPGGEVGAEPFLPEAGSREQRHRWALAAVLSPQYSYRDAENQAASGLPVQETGMLTYAGGINVSYSPASRLAIESGIFFNRMGIDVNAMSINRESAIDMNPLSSADALPGLVSASNTIGNIVTKSGGIYVNNYMLNARDQASLFKSVLDSDQSIRQQMDYLEVPFNLRYTLIDKDLEVQLVGGVSANLLINSHVTIEAANGDVQSGYLYNIRDMNYTGNAGLGMIYHIAGNFSLRLEPRFRYFLNSINDSSLPSTRPYAFGLYTGMSYLF